MTRLARVLVIAAALGLGGAGAVAAGCSRKDADDGAAVVDTELLAYLSAARALHHQADLKRQNGDVPGAVLAMQKLLSAPRPHDGRPVPEIEEVLADAHARLAELELERGNVLAAGDAAKGGLAHAPDVSYFRGHLVEMQGLVEEARAAELADAGKPEEAAKARGQAIQLLEEVVRIQEQVIQRSVGGRDGGAAEGPR